MDQRRNGRAMLSAFQAFVSRSNSLTLGLINVLGSLFIYFVFVGMPMWGTNDDILLSGMAAGAFLANGEPTAEITFVSTYFGEILLLLYRLSPGIPWYGLSFVLIVIASLLSLNVTLLRQERRLSFYLLVALLTIFSVIYVLSFLQFTVVTSLATMAGLFLFLSTLVNKEKTRSLTLANLGIAFAFLLVASLIRFWALGQVFATFFIPAALLYFRNNISQKEQGKRRLRLGIILAGAVFLSLSLIMEWNSNLANSDSNEWRYWYKVKISSSQFLDFGMTGYSDETAAEFDAIGWSKTDYDMLKTWQYIDPKVFSLENFEQVISELEDPSPIGALLSGDTDQQMLTLERVRFGIAMSILSFKKAPFILLFFFLAGLVPVFWAKNKWMYVGALLINFLLIQFFLAFGVKRLPLYLLMVFWMLVLWGLLFLVTAGQQFSESQLENKKPIGKWVQGSLFLSIILALIFKIGEARSAEQRIVALQNEMKDVVALWKKELPPDALVFSPAGLFPFGYHMPLNSFNYVKELDRFIFTGTPNQSPHHVKLMESLGLGGDFYFELANDKLVYITDGHRQEDSRAFIVSTLTNYYLERYNIILTVTNDGKYPHLSRMEFRPAQPEY